jgi:hypothetical protein
MCTCHPGRLGGEDASHIVPDKSNSACHFDVGETLLEHTFLAMEIAALASLIGNVAACAGTAATMTKAASKGLSSIGGIFANGVVLQTFCRRID